MLRRAVTFVSVLCLSAAAVVAGQSAVGAGPSARAVGTDVSDGAPALPIGHSGRWLTDAEGRVLLIHGVNFVSKNPGETPASRGFGADDIAFIKANGFDVVRLGLSPNNVMPTPGVVDDAYLDSYVQTAHDLTAAGLLVLVDLHQDGWGPAVCGNGFPEWMTLTHGAENTCTTFPLYYITNPAIQASFQSFWGNEAGPGGTGLQDQVAAMFGALADRLHDDPGILGYEFLNEPWPGTTWQPCLNDAAGCPDLDHSELDPFHARATAAVRAHDTTHLVFGEPFVLFNFGQSATSIAVPGNDPDGGMAFHTYTTDVAKEPVNVAEAIAWSGRTGGALLNTEWGATTDPVPIDRQASLLDSNLVPWIWWTYEQGVIADLSKPAGDDNTVPEALDAIERPHAVAIAGTPQSSSYDRPARVLRFSASTTGPGGRHYPDGTVSSFSVPARTYPDGVDVRVAGGHLVAQGDGHITVAADAGAESFSVKAWPKGQPEPPDDTSTTTTSTSTPGGTGTTGTTSAPATAVPAASRFTG